MPPNAVGTLERDEIFCTILQQSACELLPPRLQSHQNGLAG